MKKTIMPLVLLATLTVTARAQVNLDTVRVRNLQLTTEQWCWAAGSVGGNDSVSILALKIIRNKVQTLNQQTITWSTPVSVDSIPGKAVLGIYQSVSNGSSAEVAAMYTAVRNAISAAAPQLSYYIAQVNDNANADFDRRRALGRQKIINK